MIRNERHDVVPPVPAQQTAKRGGLSEFDGQKLAVVMTCGKDRLVVRGTAAFVRDDTVGNTLKIRLEDCEPGDPVLIIVEDQWKGRIVPDFHFGCDFCLIMN
ncbi:MAG: hypothetical protein ACYC6N_28390 [Pirellulaceae bacterium]